MAADYPTSVASFAFTPTAGKGLPYDDYLKVHDEIVAVETHLLSAFTPVTYAGGNFTAGGAQTWTVESGDQLSYAYKKIGRLMLLMAEIDTSTIGGTPATTLRIAVPGGFTIARSTRNQFVYANNGAALQIGMAYAQVSTTYVQLYRLDLSNWTAGTNNNAVYVQMFLETTA